MNAKDLDGLRVILEDPIQIDEGFGHLWFSDIAQFATGELMTTVAAVADESGLAIHAERVYFSTDLGRTWEYRYTVSEARGYPKLARPDGDMLIVRGDLDPDPPGQWRTFRGPYIRYQEGGQRIVVENGGTRFEGLPRDIAPKIGEVFPGSVNQGLFSPSGEAIEIDGRLLSTAELRFQGDDLNTTVVIESDDEGRIWRYLSTVASVPDTPEGADEPSMTQLETGELMCVMRVGSGRDWNLARTYSSDEGRSWSPVDRLSAWSVRPRLLRLTNGVLLISTGRPGIYLWLSTDPRGEHWQKIDLVAHHNQWAPDPGYTIVPELFYTPSGQRTLRRQRDQTTAYTSMVEIEPNRVLMTYDRVPFGWNPVPTNSDQRSRVLVLPLTVERT